MNQAKLLLIGICILTVLIPARAGITPDANEILKQTKETLEKIHTASYDVTKRMYYTVTDSFYMSVTHEHFVECENPADTAKNAFKVVFDKETGKFQSAYDGNKSYYINDDYILMSNPHGFNGIKTVKPPFFNHATSLTDYLLTPNPKVETTLEDHGSYWIIDARIREFQMITFFGKAYQMPSLPNVLTLYRMRINKHNMLPDQLDYYIGWPQQRWVEECSNVSLNPFPADSFSVTVYLPDLPQYDSDSAPKMSKKMKEHYTELIDTSVPADTLTTSNGTIFSLRELLGRPVLMILTSSACGPCIASYPVLNRIKTDYSGYSLEVVGVMRESSAQPEAISRYAKKHNINFPLVIDNNRFHEYFSLTVTPVFVMIDEKGIVRDMTTGFSPTFIEKSEQELRKMIERHLPSDKQ